jgi:hypothetical protein
MITKRTLTSTLFAMLLFALPVPAQDPVPIYPDNYKVMLENDGCACSSFS